VESGTIDREAMRNMWDARARQTAAEAAANPFSQNFDASAAKAAVRHDDTYGRPVAGSKTEERAKAAQNWVEQAIEKLVSVIRSDNHRQLTIASRLRCCCSSLCLPFPCFQPNREIGRPDAQRRPHITFGELFLAYQDISDTLVGIMMRAKKRGLIEYEGDMLFQGVNDGVVITVLN
jgi:hypothetical protein